jgi:hypothetical protein
VIITVDKTRSSVQQYVPVNDPRGPSNIPLYKRNKSIASDMKFIVVWLVALSSTCNVPRCKNEPSYQLFSNLLSLDTGSKQVQKFNKQLLEQLCEKLSNTRKILYIQQMDPFGNSRKGLIHDYDNKKRYFFEGRAMPQFRLELKEWNDDYIPFKLLDEYLNENDEVKVEAFKNSFSPQDMDDPPMLQIALIEDGKIQFHKWFRYTPDEMDLIKK